MRVWVDDQIFSMQVVGGISRYFSNLLPLLSEEPHLTIDLGVWVTGNQHLEWPYVLHPPGPPSAYPRRLLDALNRPRRRSAARADLVHHTFYRPERLHLCGADTIPRVCTIYDMIPETASWDDAGRGSHMAKHEYVERSDGIAVISDSSRREMERVYGTLDKPVKVTPLGVDQRFQVPGGAPVGVPQPYVLYVGRRSGYKEFGTLLVAFRALLREHPDLHLLCVGGGAFSPAEQTSIEDGAIGRRVHQRSVAEEELPGVYGAAAAFCFPSRHEGFGLPLLEAMAAGCPVVCSDADALVEVADGAAAIFPAGNAEALEEVLARTVGGHRDVQERVERGRRRAREATWRRTAELTRELYEEVIQSR